MQAQASGGPPPHGVPTVRMVVGVFVLPALMLAGAVGFALTVQGRLPTPMATHWSGTGTTNGTMSFTSFVVTVGGIGLVLWAIGAAAAVLGRSMHVRFGTERAAMAWCCATTAFVSSLFILTVLVNLDQPTASTAKLPGIAILPTLCVAAIAGVVGWILAGPRPETPAIPEHLREGSTAVPTIDGLSPDARVAAVIDLPAGEHPMWQRHQTSTVIITLVFASLVVAVIGYFLLPILAITFLIVAIVSTPLASITAIVDHTGLTVRFGALGWPTKHIACDQIESVVSDNIEPLMWGGWGYRLMPGRSAVVLRKGPALIVQLHNGTAFAVTVDDPAQGAALLDAYRRRSHP